MEQTLATPARQPVLTTPALRALAALLTYPEPELIDALPDIADLLEHEPALPAIARRRLTDLMLYMQDRPLLDLQEDYVAWFDRGRSLSLCLFEHVHGESRDRGQAMVDLLALYRSHGLQLASSELPDFLPAFLEFLACLPRATAFEHLGDVAHILQALSERATKRDVPYAAVFAALHRLAGPAGEAEPITTPAAEPATLEALDQQWQDQEVIFGPGGMAECQKAAQPARHTIHMHPRGQRDNA